MLKSRLFTALLAVVLLLLTAGGVSIWLVRDHVAGFERAVGKNFEAIRLVNDFRLISTALESSYLPALEMAEQPADADSSALEEYRRRYVRDLEALRLLIDEVDSLGESERAALEEVESSVTRYVSLFDRLFDPSTEIATREQRVAIRSEILGASHEMATRVVGLLDLLEQSVAAEKAHAVRQAQISIRSLIILIGFAVLIAVLLYFTIVRRVIQPVIDLTESVREVQQQNFERVVPVKSADEVGRLAAAFNDMAAELRIVKHETDRELLRLNRESRSILSGFPHPIFMLSGEGEVTRSNPAAEHLMERLETERRLPMKVGRKVVRCIEKDEDYLPDEINEAMLFRADERESWYLPRIFRVRDPEDPTFRGWAVVLIDVTRVRWLDDMKSDLIGTVSHEIKTPLTSIRMVLHLLAEQKTGSLNDTQEKMVGSARDDCEKLLETLENLLQLSRMESGASRLNREAIPPGDLIAAASETFAGPVADARLKIRTNLPGKPLPRVLADRIQIGQVFNNLLSNAVKHSPENGEIVLSAKARAGDFVRFSVTDEGPGVEEGEQDKIFDRFYRVPGQNGDGSGLGLSICREIIRAHAGRIGIDNEPGKPTTFYFDIPLSSR